MANPLSRQSHDSEREISVVALTETNVEKHLTWKLRVELLLPHLRQLGIRVETVHLPKSVDQRQAALDTLKDYDIVWLHRLIVWPREVRRFARIGSHLVLDIDDPVCFSSSRWQNFSLSKGIKFLSTLRRCSAVLAASDGLRKLAGRGCGSVYFVPLCADPGEHTMRVRSRSPSESLRLLWVGGRSTFKYLARIRPQLEAIGAELPNATLTVVGHERLELSQLRVENIPWSPENERRLFSQGHVGISPLPDDRWSRAKAALKPLQYLANGMPFIGSPIGVNVAISDAGRNALLADRPREWVQAARRLEADERLRRQMGAAGIDFIRRCHSPDVLAQRVADAFRDVVAGRCTRASAA